MKAGEHPETMAEDHSRTAPFYDIPNRPMVCIEHPAIIKNVDKAIDMLQGSAGIIKTLNPPKADTPANLVLRPEDAMARPLQSLSSPSNNILLQVTVPKRTGRKRKRGSNEPFVDDPDFQRDNGPPRPTARQLLKSLRDNVGKYQVEPVGLVERTHTFRGIPDFVYSTTNSPFVSRFREQILSFNLQKMKSFDLDMSKGAVSNVDILPPPTFSHGDIPFNYFYRQNPTVKQTLDKAGNPTTINTQQAAKVLTHLVPYDIPIVPSGPRANCPPLESITDPILRETIAIVKRLFGSRPAWSRRALRNQLTTLEQRYALRHAIPYAGYIFRSGPWRDAIIAFGQDPRTDPSWRIYQTAMFRILPGTSETARDRHDRDRDATGGRRHTLLPRPAETNTNRSFSTTDNPEGNVVSSNSHLFTGHPPLPLDGRMWMFCDITDPLLLSILHPPSPPLNFLKEKCDIAVDGWIGNGTAAKLKSIMRHKILAMYEGRPVPRDSEYAPILAMPDHATPEQGLADFFPNPDVFHVQGWVQALATELRGIIKSSPAWRERKRGVVKQGVPRKGKGEVEGEAEVDEEEEEEEGEEVEGEDESEGEEEAIEQEEMLEAVDAAASRQDQDDNDEADDVDDEME
ncbi:transcription factor TFIIIC subunit TFC1 [Aspergillus undulatus]|uniref:transcription factor TFIIIC subunit TFC1 n=1 Tax=Aspergillus undulatus TaxID=1810928 RepID=UPI003CCCC3A1